MLDFHTFPQKTIDSALVKIGPEFQVRFGFRPESTGIPGNWDAEFRIPVDSGFGVLESGRFRD